jgi:Ca2+-transporting ATPase
MNGNPVTIIKDGKLIITNEDSLCKDDLVFIQAGDLVPADLILVEAIGLETDEFDITGEIMPVIKKVGEQDGILYMGSRITKGSGKGIVIATGDQTEFRGALKQSWERSKPCKLHIFDRISLGTIGLLLPAFIILFTVSVNSFL